MNLVWGLTPNSLHRYYTKVRKMEQTACMHYGISISNSPRILKQDMRTEDRIFISRDVSVA